MADTVSIHIRWDRSLAAKVRSIAGRHHTTLSELTRQAVIDKYSLHADDLNPDKSATNQDEGGSLS